MKFKLQATHDDGTVVTHEFEEDVWYAALDGFVKFLRGSYTGSPPHYLDRGHV